MYFLMFVGACLIGLGIGLLSSNDPQVLTLDVCTFKGSNEVKEVHLYGPENKSVANGFEATIHNYVLNKETTESGRSIGELQYNISRTFKRWAQDELGEKFNQHQKGYDSVRLTLTFNGDWVTQKDYARLTTNSMRSTKNPIARIERYKHSAPMTGYGEIIYRKKL